MAGPSTIEWTDATWNPVTGCTKVSAGCDHCYAEAIARRFAGTKAFPNGFTVTLHPDRLAVPMSWRAPRRVFVNSMSDLFHDAVPDGFIGSVFDVMARTPQHTYQILTKRHARMRSLLNRWGRDGWTWRRDDGLWCGPAAGPLPNVWLGVSVEDQQWANIRIPALIDTPAAVRFLSCEPLLGPVDLLRWLRPTPDCGHVDPDDGCCLHPAAPHAPECHSGVTCPFGVWRGVDWVICGGESGQQARPMHPDWARGLRDQCQAAGSPFFFKQWGTHTWDNGQPHRVGKHAAGRVLDGRTWDEYPTAAGGGAR